MDIYEIQRRRAGGEFSLGPILMGAAPNALAGRERCLIVDQRVCKSTLTSVKDSKGRKKIDVIWAVFEDAFSNNLQLTGPDDAPPGEGHPSIAPSSEDALDVFGQVYPAANLEHQFGRLAEPLTEKERAGSFAQGQY